MTKKNNPLRAAALELIQLQKVKGGRFASLAHITSEKLLEVGLLYASCAGCQDDWGENYKFNDAVEELYGDQYTSTITGESIQWLHVGDRVMSFISTELAQ